MVLFQSFAEEGVGDAQRHNIADVTEGLNRLNIGGEGHRADFAGKQMQRKLPRAPKRGGVIFLPKFELSAHPPPPRFPRPSAWQTR